jgi:hypothetical protein
MEKNSIVLNLRLILKIVMTCHEMSETLQLYLLCGKPKKRQIFSKKPDPLFLDLGGSEDVKNGISTAIFERILRAKREKKTFRCFSLICPG